MAQFFLDNFSTGSTVDLTAHTSDSGASWIAWYVAGGATTPKVYAANGGILACSTGGNVRYRASTISPTPDVTVSGIARVDANGGYNFIGWCARLNSAGTAGYLAGYDLGGQRWQLYRLGASGAGTLLAQSAVIVLTPSSDINYEFSVTGTVDATLALKIDGATVVSIVDVAPASAYLAAGYVGYSCNGNIAGTGIFINSMSADDSAVPATAITLSGPTTGAVGSPSTNFTVGANGTITGTVVVTPSDSGAGGTFTPTSISISTGSPTGTFTYTPATSGAKTISVTNNGGLTNPASITYTASGSLATAITMTGPTSGVSGVASTPFSVGANGVITGTVTVTPSDSGGGGTFAPTSVAISAGSPSATFTYTPSSTGAKTISSTNNGGLTNPASITYTANSSGNISGTALYSKLVFSPYNWEVTSAKAKTWHPGAYFKMIFEGSSCTLNFDTTNMGAVLPQLVYQVDGTGPWTQVNCAASVPITIPVNVANSTRHYLDVIVKVAGGVNCWTTDNGSVILTSVTLEAGKALFLPTPPTVKKGIFFGDSITNGDLAVQGSGNDAGDARASWAFQIGKLLNSEFGICAFGSTRWTGIGGGGTGIPGLVDSYNLKSAGVTRDFTSPAPDYIIINMGTNDSSGVTAAVIGTLNGLIAATPSTTKIIVMRPFNGSNAAAIQSGIAGCSSPSRIYYMDTTGFLDTNFVDGSGLHPLAFENVTHIVPQVLPLVVSAFSSSPALTVRSVSITLRDQAGLVANATGLSVSFYDETTPSLATVARYQNSAATTNASGVLSFTCNSSLGTGASGYISVLHPDGRHFNGSVMVA